MRLTDFKGKYRGHRAFFIGNGPSLNQTPLHLMKDEYCFGTNKVYDLFEVTDWRPTHFVAITNENWKYKDWAEAIEKIVATGIPCFLSDRYWIYYEIGRTHDWYKPPEGDNVIQIKARKLMRDRNGEMISITGWATDIEEFIISHRTVSMVFLQLAHWMGFSPLYLVGCDLGYKPHFEGEPDPNHWNTNYEHRKTVYRARYDNIRMKRVHGIMSKIAKREGIEVYNATIGGELEAYERVDIYDILR